MTGKLQKCLLISVLAVAVISSPSMASARWGHHHHGDVAIGVLGGILGGIIVDRIFLPPQRVLRKPCYKPGAACRHDAYEEGYWEGYEAGVEQEQHERYQRERRRGYEDGVDAGRRDMRF